MASIMYDQKKQAIEEKKKRRCEEAESRCRDAKEKADKGRRSAGRGAVIGFGVFFTKPGLIIAGLILLAAFSWGGPVGLAIAGGVFVLWIAGATGVGIFTAHKSNTQADNEIRAAREARRSALESAEQDYQKELKQLELWYQNYEESVKQQAKKYANSPEAARLAQKLEYQFEQMIETFRRNPTVKMIEVDFDYGVGRGQICYLSNSFIDFEQERLNSLQSPLQCEALAQALARLIKGNVLKKYSQGQIKISHNDASVQMHYTGINPNHVPKRNI